jgi:SagB-type dehydrogenase family enzyme
MGREGVIPLPGVSHDGAVSVERAITGRHSTRDFSGEPATVEELGQLLWAGQGITEVTDGRAPVPRDRQRAGGSRTAPSAGALFPLELYVLVGEAEGIDRGAYHYLPHEHGLLQMTDRDLRTSLWQVALRQEPIRRAPITIVISAVIERTAAKYGGRAERYVDIEVGAVAENICLQAESLGLGSVFIGAFQDQAARQVLSLPRNHRVLGIVPIGRSLAGSPDIASDAGPKETGR